MLPVALTTGKKSNNPITFGFQEESNQAVEDGIGLNLSGATGNNVRIGSAEEFERAANIADSAVAFGASVADSGLRAGLDGLLSAGETIAANSDNAFNFGVEALASNIVTTETSLSLVDRISQTFSSTLESISRDNSQTAQSGLGVANTRSILPAENVSIQSNDNIMTIAIVAAIAVASVFIFGRVS